MFRAASFALLVLGADLAVGCTSIAGDLRTAEVLYKDARYEQAQLWLVDLERERAAMDSDDLARFYYLRGMAAFRLGQREDALHYLALAEVLSAEDENVLPSDWRSTMQRTLQDITPTTASPHARNPLKPDTI